MSSEDEIWESHENDLCSTAHSDDGDHNLPSSSTTNDLNESFEVIESEDWEVIETEHLDSLSESNSCESQFVMVPASSHSSSTTTPLVESPIGNAAFRVNEGSFYSVEGLFNDRSKEILYEMINTFEGNDICEAYEREADEIRNIRDDIFEDIYEDDSEHDSQRGKKKNELFKEEEVSERDDDFSYNEYNLSENEDRQSEDEEDISQDEDSLSNLGQFEDNLSNMGEDEDDPTEIEDDLSQDEELVHTNNNSGINCR